MSLTAPTAQSDPQAGRRYDLDWLRIIAFAILIFYHIGMFYVTWDWHVKSPHAGTGPQVPMMLVNAWRLALLFFISGIALRYATDKAADNGRLSAFGGTRLRRLLWPILFGMAVVVAPQSYFELRQGGVIEAGYLDFYRQYLSFDADVIRRWELIVPTWNHLWYVVYLLVYTLILVPLSPLLRRAAGWLERVTSFRGSAALVLIVPVLPFLLYRFALVPYFEQTHNLVWDWANHANSFTILLLGFLLAKNEGFWRAVRTCLPASLLLVTACVPLFSWFWRDAAFETLAENPVALTAIQSLRVLYAWWVILGIAGAGQMVLNRDSAALRYMTGMIFCWYILHQTITVIAGYYLAGIGLPAWPEFAILTAVTFGGCLAGGEIIRRVPLLRPLFGMKPRAERAKVSGRDDRPRRSAHGAHASSSAS